MKKRTNKIWMLKHIFALLTIIIIAIICFLWIGYDTVRNSVGVGSRVIVNDDYTVLTQPITDDKGVVQPITVEAETSFYGVNINFHTYDRVCFGKVFVDLLDESGNILASASDDMTTIKDNTFKRFIFGKKDWKSDKQQRYYLHIYIKPDTQEDKIALWKSAETKENFENIYENQIQTEGTLALQYIDNYAGISVLKYYIMLCALILIFIVGVYLVLFVIRVKQHTAFLVFACLLGVIFSVYTPQRGAPDEYVHIASSYNISNKILSVEDSYKDGYLKMRSCDAGYSLDKPVNYNVFEIQTTYDGLWQKSENDNMELVKARVANVFPPLYWAQAVGITLARVFGLGYIPMLILGRLFNLALYVAVVYFAIRIMPIYKTMFTLLALTPIPLQLAASFSYDTFVISFSFLYISYVFYCAYKKDTVIPRDIIILTALAMVLAPSKTVYIALIGLCLIIPYSKFKNKKTANLSYTCIVLSAIVMWFSYNATALKTVVSGNHDVSVSSYEQSADGMQEVVAGKTNGDKVEPEQEYDVHADIMANGDNRNLFSIGYILHNVPQTVKLVANTVQENTAEYIRQIFGGVLGEVIVSPVQIKWIYTMIVIMVVLLAVLQDSGDSIIYKGAAKWWGFFVATIVCALFCLACITWTPINYTTIFGIQGRYFYPVLPLLMMMFGTNCIEIKKDISKVLIYVLCIVNAFILLNGFSIMVSNTTIKY